MVFHVYVDGVTGTSPEAAHELSETMSAHYGVPAAELYARLLRGPFRVKANVDESTAALYARNLAAIGARVHVERAEDAGAPVPGAPAAALAPGARPTQSGLRPARSSLPPQPEARQTRSSLVAQAHEAARSALPPQPEARQTRPALVAQAHEAARSALPPQPEARPTRPALVAQAHEAARQTRPSLAEQAHEATRQVQSALPPQPEARQAQSALPPQPARRSTRPSLPPQPSLPPSGGPANGSTRPSSLSSRARPSAEILAPDDDVDVDVGLGGPDNGQGALEDELGGLGALDGDLSLAMLDNVQAPPRSVPDAPAVQAGTAAPRARIARPTDEPADLFAPPDEAAGELDVELATDELAYRASKQRPASITEEPPWRRTAAALSVGAAQPAGRTAAALSVGAEPPARSGGQAYQLTMASPMGRDAAAAPGDASSSSWSGTATSARMAADRRDLPPMRTGMVAGAEQTAAPVLAQGSESLAQGSESLARVPARASLAVEPAGSWLSDPRRLMASPRVRLATGVAAAIVLGFVPADVVATLREHSALRAIDAHVTAVQAAADSRDAYDALDGVRAEQLAAKRSKHREIVLTSLLVWAAASSALGYLWFRRIRWPAPGEVEIDDPALA